LSPKGEFFPLGVNFFPQGWIFSPGDEIICSALEYKLAPRAKLHPWGQTILLKTGHRVPRQYINSFFSTGIMAQASLHLQPDYSLFTEILCCTTQVLCMYIPSAIEFVNKKPFYLCGTTLFWVVQHNEWFGNWPNLTQSWCFGDRVTKCSRGKVAQSEAQRFDKFNHLI
jgi:hypothetical protein